MSRKHNAGASDDETNKVTSEMQTVSAVKLRGFAAMSKEERRRVASAGGRTAVDTGMQHKLTKEDRERAAVGRRRVKRERAYYVELGRKGGLAHAARRRAAAEAESRADDEREQP